MTDTMKSAALGCRCGKVRGRVVDPAPGNVNRMVCYCDDCQTFLHYLKRADLLDEHGGTDVVQVAPARLRFEQGAEQILAFSAVITRDGNISAMQALGDGRGSRHVARLINEISQGRLVPARYGTDPIAVNLVWLVEHMTVKPKNPRSVGS